MTVSAIKELSRTAEGRQELIQAGMLICSFASHTCPDACQAQRCQRCPCSFLHSSLTVPLLVGALLQRLPAAYSRLFRRAIFSRKGRCRQHTSWTGSKSEARADRCCTGLVKMCCCSAWCNQWATDLGLCEIKAAAAIAAGAVTGSTVESAAVAVALPAPAVLPC